MRVGQVKRTTAETDISLSICLDGSGKGQINTGVAFLDHMLAQIAKHGLFDLEVSAKGDTDVDYHHTVEDVGICLGLAFAQALESGKGIRRFAHAIVPMDEALVMVSLDLCGRGYASTTLSFSADKVGSFDCELIPEFFRAFAHNANLALHVRQLDGSNAHHIIEAAFKGLALALRDAVALDPRQTGVPSTKGTLL